MNSRTGFFPVLLLKGSLETFPRDTHRLFKRIYTLYTFTLLRYKRLLFELECEKPGSRLWVRSRGDHAWVL